MNNTLLKELTDIDFKKILELIDKKEIPDNFDNLKDNVYRFNLDEITQNYIFREQCINKIGYVLLSHNLINVLAAYLKNKKCLEVMAGCGSISKCLKDKGIDIIATDNYSWNNHYWFNKNNNWCDIENIDCVKAIQKYGQSIDYIIMSWPPYDSPEANNVLLEVQRINKEFNKNIKIIYIGEGKGGCTANDDFFENIMHVNNLKHINKHFYNHFGIHDFIIELY